VICDFGDIIIVPFPFVDMPVVKRRPAMVLSNTRFNRSNGQTIAAMITSARLSSWPTDIHIEHPSPAGLSNASVIRWKLFTLPNDLIVRRAGQLAEDDRSRAAIAAKTHLGAPS
jgi:mRNA interferase MazF